MDSNLYSPIFHLSVICHLVLVPQSSSIMSHISRLYNVEVVQFWRGREEPRHYYPFHWAIYVETGHGMGSAYQIIGNINNYAIEIKHNRLFENRKHWRGSFIVGTVTWAELSEMESILGTVQVIRGVPTWNSRSWIASALTSLSMSGLSGITIMSQDRLHDLHDNMCWLSEVWTRIDNAVEYATGEDLTCLVINKKPNQWYWSASNHECDSLCELLRELVDNNFNGF
ncbi:hypothetical protein BDR07DRAFT_1402555 [Suillus spraguei]|nr:hypothetical protein BDR07DRAFT_1402555 [Suillus spraguei]